MKFLKYLNQLILINRKTDDMKSKNYSKGFTVLELLVILTILIILMGLVLTNLNSTKKSSLDDRRINNLQAVALGLQEYLSICRSYPATLTETETCTALSPKTLKDIVPLVTELNFNNTNSKYHYAGLLVAAPGQLTCTNFHMWVELEKNVSSLFSTQKSDITSSKYPYQNMTTCLGSEPDLTTMTTQIFDIFR